MSEELAAILAKHHKDPTRLVDMLHDLQLLEGQISEAAIEQIGQETGLARTDIEQTMSFYHFFSRTSRGKYTVYLNNSAVAEMMDCATAGSLIIISKTASNPVLTLERFPCLHHVLLSEQSGILPRFDLAAAVQESCVC
jgi:NADH:ubiquinone oxidoreductase subunit E